MRFVRAALVLFAVGLALALSPLPRARAVPLRAMVRLAEPHDRALFSRLRGQSSDLEVQLTTATTEPLEPTFGAQLATARALAEERDATVFIWFARREARMVVYVVDLAADRVFARALEEGEGALDASALEESAALVVRSALRASLAGAALETPEPERVAEVVAPRAPEPAPPPPSPPPTPPPPPKTQEPVAPKKVAVSSEALRRVALWGGVGAEGALDGFVARGRYALGARLLLTMGRFEAGVSGAYGLSAHRTTEVAEVSFALHRATVQAGVRLFERGSVRLSLEAAASLHIATTRVREAIDDFQETEQRALLFGLEAMVRVALIPRWAGDRLALVPSIGCAVLPERPVIGYDAPQGFVPVRALYPVQPLLRLEAWVRF